MNGVNIIITGIGHPAVAITIRIKVGGVEIIDLVMRVDIAQLNIAP